VGIELLALRGIAERVREDVRRWQAALLWLAVALAVAAVACVLLFVSLYLFVAERLPPWAAAAITAAVAAGLAVVFALAARRQRVRPARRAASEPPSATVLDEALRGTNVRSTDLVLTSLVAGLMLGMGSRRRSKDASSGD